MQRDNGSCLCHAHLCRNCNSRPRSTSGDAAGSQPSLSRGHLGKRSSAEQTTQNPMVPKAPRLCHGDIVRNTVLTMMDSWFIEENNILSESLDEQEEGYDRIVATQAQEIANLRAQLDVAEETERLRTTQLMQYRRFCNMVFTWCNQANEMFPGDFNQMVMIHEEQNRELAAYANRMADETDDEE